MKNIVSENEIGKAIEEFLMKRKEENCSVEPADVIDYVSEALEKKFGKNHLISNEVADYMQDHEIDDYYLDEYFED